MSLLQFIVIIAATLFILLGIDLYRHKKTSILHFVVFLWGGIAIILFVFNQDLLNAFGEIFGLARGADLIVYIAVILLFYFYFGLLNLHIKDGFNLTRLVSRQAIYECWDNSKDKIINYKNQNFKDEFIFNIRVYNEAFVLWSTIDEIIKAGFSKLLIINDGSQDNSSDIVKAKQAQYPNKLILLASHTINRGGGAANQTGYNFVKKYGENLGIKRFVGFDADGQMQVEDMNQFIKAIQEHPKDLYLGSRFIKWGKATNITKSRKKILRISKIVTRILYSSKVSDPHCGYRVISLPALQKFNLSSDGMHYANEFNEQLREKNLSYKEIPIHIRYTEYSLKKWQKNSNSIKLWFEMLYKKIFFR
jgi:polyprenyl-phospho-N-acetylgalactosaminyl synthase